MQSLACSLSSYRPWAGLALALATVKLVLNRAAFTLRGLPLHYGLWQIGFLSVWVIYSVVIYPRFFSPLRHLPQPEVGTQEKTPGKSECFLQQYPGCFFSERALGCVRRAAGGYPIQKMVQDNP